MAEKNAYLCTKNENHPIKSEKATRTKQSTK